MRMGLGSFLRTKVLCSAEQSTEVPLFLRDYDSCFVMKLRMVPVGVMKCQSWMCSGRKVEGTQRSHSMADGLHQQVQFHISSESPPMV